jgi:hypothetical protein
MNISANSAMKKPTPLPGWVLEFSILNWLSQCQIRKSG